MLRTRYKGTRVTRDGRTVLSAVDYRKLRREVFEYQEEQCFLCNWSVPFERFELHHHGERGLGGSRRDDVPWFENSWARIVAQNEKGDDRMITGFVYGLCKPCHQSVDRKRLHFSRVEDAMEETGR